MKLHIWSAPFGSSDPLITFYQYVGQLGRVTEYANADDYVDCLTAWARAKQRAKEVLKVE